MQLASRKFRDRYGLYLIEGEHLLSEAIKCDIKIKDVFIREDYGYQGTSGNPEPYVLSRKLFDGLAQTEASQGIIAIVGKAECGADSFFKACAGKNILVADRVRDPGNIGTMIRTADAAGYGGVMIIKGTADVFSPKTVRASSGSLFRMPFLFIDTPGEAVKSLKENGKKIVGACFDTETCYYDADLSRDIALLIGNEAEGLCGELMSELDYKVKIPMAPAVDSLNAAVAAGILMYESKRKDKG